MADLTGGRWPQYNPYDRIFNFSNATQANVPARSNAYYTGINVLTDQATAATKKGVFVPIPVEYGDVISKVSVLIGATEGKTSVFSFFALYGGAKEPKGKGKLLAQSAVSEAATGVSKVLTGTLEKSQLITTTNAPFGYVWAGFTIEATPPTLIGFNLEEAAQYEWFTGSPEGFAVIQAQKEKSVAETEITLTGAVTTKKVPLVFLT